MSFRERAREWIRQQEDAAASRTAKAEVKNAATARRNQDWNASRFGGGQWDADARVLHLKGKGVQEVRRQGGIGGVLAYGGVGAILNSGYDDVRRFKRDEHAALPLRSIVSVGNRDGGRTSVVASDGREFRFYMAVHEEDEMSAAVADVQLAAA